MMETKKMRDGEERLLVKFGFEEINFKILPAISHHLHHLTSLSPSFRVNRISSFTSDF